MKVATWDARSRRFRHGSIDSVGPKPEKGYPRYRTYAEVTGAPWRPHPENGWTTKPIRGHELDSESNQFAYLISKKKRSPTSSPMIPYKYTGPTGPCTRAPRITTPKKTTRKAPHNIAKRSQLPKNVTHLKDATWDARSRRFRHFSTLRVHVGWYHSG